MIFDVVHVDNAFNQILLCCYFGYDVTTDFHCTISMWCICFVEADVINIYEMTLQNNKLAHAYVTDSNTNNWRWILSSCFNKFAELLQSSQRCIQDFFNTSYNNLFSLISFFPEYTDDIILIGKDLTKLQKRSNKHVTELQELGRSSRNRNVKFD